MEQLEKVSSSLILSHSDCGPLLRSLEHGFCGAQCTDSSISWKQGTGWLHRDVRNAGPTCVGGHVPPSTLSSPQLSPCLKADGTCTSPAPWPFCFWLGSTSGDTNRTMCGGLVGSECHFPNLLHVGNLWISCIPWPKVTALVGSLVYPLDKVSFSRFLITSSSLCPFMSICY